MNILITNEQETFKVTEEIEDIITQSVKKVMELESVKDNAEVSVLFVDNEGIRTLNREFRSKDSTTDVLSFPQYESSEEIKNDPEPILGDIVISLERAKEQSEEFGHSFEREIGFLTVHSMYHLLGLDHNTEENTKEMRAKEEAALEALGLKR